MSTWRFVSRKGQGHCLTFGRGLSQYDNLKHILKSHWSKCNQFLEDLLGLREWKYLQTVMVTWPIWPPCPYIVKTFKESSLPEPTDQWPWNLVYSIGYPSTTTMAQMMTLGWSWPILRKSQLWENANTSGFTESFEDVGLKIGNLGCLNE